MGDGIDWNEVKECAGADVDFLRIGGFIFLDGRFNILNVTGLMPTKSSSALHVRGPYPMPPAYAKKLIQQSRFQPVFTPECSNAGIKSFAFLGPGELLRESTQCDILDSV